MKRYISLLVLLSLFSARAQAQVPAYLPPGLMAWWPFTGNAIDSTGNAHDGTVHGTSNAPGRYGVPNTAFRFNGTSDYIYVPPGSLIKDISVDITASLTISAWVRSDNYFFTGQMQIYWRGDATPAHDPHMLYLNGGEVRIRRDVDPGSTINEVGGPLAGLDNTYHLFTGTYDSATSIMCIYIDGVMKEKSYMPGLQTYPTGTMYNYIGAVDGGTWQFFYGDIDELGIWSRALTPCEVAALYYSVPRIITAQPVHDTTSVGGAASFTVGALAPLATYQWQVRSGASFVDVASGTPYSGVNTPTLTISPATAALTGKEYRCLISSDSCTNVSTDTVMLTVTPATALPPAQVVADVSISPHPNNGEFILSGVVTSVEPLSLIMMDITGRAVYKERISASAGPFRHSVVLPAGIGNGIYLLRILSGQSSLVFRVVVER